VKPRYRKRIQAKFPVTVTVGLHASEGRILDLTVPGCLIESPHRHQKRRLPAAENVATWLHIAMLRGIGSGPLDEGVSVWCRVSSK
jgi:hypothetical protein